MPTKTQHIRGNELPPSLQNRFKVKPHQCLKVTVEIENDDEEYDIANVGDALIEGFRELVEAKKNSVELQNAEDLLKTL